jgi:hypothetical protein
MIEGDVECVWVGGWIGEKVGEVESVHLWMSERERVRWKVGGLMNLCVGGFCA